MHRSQNMAVADPSCEDCVNVQIEVMLNDLPSGDPVCRRLAQLILESSQYENFTSDVQALLDLPKEFRVNLYLVKPGEVEERPVMVEPPELTVKAQDCPECTAYSWEKGCSSWPW